MPATPSSPGCSRIRVGFIPLTDCAPLVMAAAKGFDRKYGIKLALSREPSSGPPSATSCSAADWTRHMLSMAWSTAYRWASAGRLRICAAPP